ncbi:MAG: RNA-binding protein Hfq [uncultured Sphingomonas sp.]|uniref:RNA-binding protein Hfq n=1 Tax=uncultured Sphingomonas sp. TaxID=158754 RepID=A0A6J4T8S6_9SPHN|nr:RNA chaperone Hfq [uncultured Sphingomonas sp.]CAA9516991.1 MAG: RNA-binding protein Hfq [uncultured Sphingomonas sp.]
MPDKPLSLQDHFLNSLRRSKTPVTIFLVKGVKLQGVITWFDAFSLLLRREGINQLIYKHAMSTIMPAAPPSDLDLSGFIGERVVEGRATLQDRFLAAATRQEEPMTVFLVNGVMLQGEVLAFNRFSMLLGRRGQLQLVYKHAVSTMQPGRPLMLGNGDDEEAGS